MSKITMKIYTSFFFFSVLAFGQSTAVVQPGSTPITGATTGAIVTSAGPTGPLQTPSANATVNGNGDFGGTSFNAVADGVHPGVNSFVGNTTAPAIGSSLFYWIGPPVATFTAYGLQAPNAGPSSASVMCLSTLASAISSISFCPKAGTGAAIPTGPSTSTTTDLVSYTGTAGQQQDSGIASATVATLTGSQTLTNKTMSGASNTISTYGTVVARITPLTTQAANVGATTFFTLPATSGYYQVCAEIITTQAATSSSTQPQIQAIYTSAIDSVTKFNIFVFSNTFNETGNSASGCVPIYAKASSVVQYQTQDYASTGVTAMQYALMIWAISGNSNGQ